MLAMVANSVAICKNRRSKRCLDYWRLIPGGSVPEIIVEGETGFIAEDIDRAVEAVGKIEPISRARCRREFEQRFTDRHMAQDYLRI
jgi:hypothetical protein